MENAKKIILWDSNPLRIQETSKNIASALVKTHETYVFEIMSEIPLIGRKGLQGKLPTLEIANQLWFWKTGEAIPEDAIMQLLAYLKRDK